MFMYDYFDDFDSNSDPSVTAEVTLKNCNKIYNQYSYKKPYFFI